MVLATIAISGCNKLQSVVHPTNKPTCAIVALFDISGSTVDPAIRQRYFDQFVGRDQLPKEGKLDLQSVLEQLTGGEIVRGDVITENSIATASWPINESFPPAFRHGTGNVVKHEEEMQDVKQDVKNSAKRTILQSEPRKATDLMNAFQLAEQVLSGEDADSKALVIFSDMVEQSTGPGDTDGYDFSCEKLTGKRIQQIIAKEREARRLPDLKGVRVWVAGATAATKGGLPSAKIYQIRDFWLEYFKACGADLPKNHYAATLVNFRLHPEGANTK